MKRFLILALCALFSSAALAGGTWSNVTVTQITPWTSEGFGPSGLLTVTFSANSTGGPSCGSGLANQASIDLTTVGGAYTAEVLQAARLTGATISVYGTGACTTSSTVENVSHLIE